MGGDLLAQDYLKRLFFASLEVNLSHNPVGHGSACFQGTGTAFLFHQLVTNKGDELSLHCTGENLAVDGAASLGLGSTQMRG